MFARIQTLFDQRQSCLEPEALRLLEQYHLDPVRAGAVLTESEQDRMWEINAEMATLQTSSARMS